MRSIRARLTVGYVLALALTVVLFGVILYVDRRQASLRELDDRLEVEADLTLRVLKDLSQSFGRLPPIVESVQRYFQSFRHFLILVGDDGRTVLSLDPTGVADSTALDRL